MFICIQNRVTYRSTRRSVGHRTLMFSSNRLYKINSDFTERHLFLNCQRSTRGCSVRIITSSIIEADLTFDFSDIKSPIILQTSQGGAAYFAGKGLPNDKQQASIAGAVAAAHHVRTVAKEYGV